MLKTLRNWNLICITVTALVICNCAKKNDTVMSGTVEDVITKDILANCNINVYENSLTPSSSILESKTNSLGEFNFSIYQDIEIQSIVFEKENYYDGRLIAFELESTDSQFKIGLYPEGYIRFDIVDSIGGDILVKYAPFKEDTVTGAPTEFYTSPYYFGDYDNSNTPFNYINSNLLIDSNSDILLDQQSIIKKIPSIGKIDLIIQRDSFNKTIETIELIRFDTLVFQLNY